MQGTINFASQGLLELIDDPTVVAKSIRDAGHRGVAAEESTDLAATAVAQHNTDKAIKV